MATSRNKQTTEPIAAGVPVEEPPAPPAPVEAPPDGEPVEELPDVELVEELPAEQPAAPAPAPFLSEGVRQDLDMHGTATDPATGGVFVKDRDSGAVSFTDRAGNVTQL